jgi:hypothetical protein
MNPRVFVGSSTEGIEVAEAIQSNLERAADVTVWNQDVFSLSAYNLESLLTAVATSDFGVFVLTPDDLVHFRGATQSAARDNVVFELGLFVAGLGRENTFIVRPRVVEDFRLAGDLLGLTEGTYDPARAEDNLVAALAPVCRKISRALSSNRNDGRCGYLVRFASTEEPSLLQPNCDTHVSYDRAYRLLLYMFRHESSREFRAFDLAFERWEELLRPDYQQTLNISNEIFESMERMFEEGRCRHFRRILVITCEQLHKKSAEEVLLRIDGLERGWREAYAGLLLETRVLIYPSVNSPDTRRKIRELHDFAVFHGEPDTLAIIETTLGTPTDRVEVPECRVVASPAVAGELADAFDDFWRSSRAIPQVLAELRAEPEAEQTSQPAARAVAAFAAANVEATHGSALIIEAGYFDLRAPRDEDRLRHLDDALWLLQSVQTSYPQLRGSVFLEAFINDLSSINVCQIEACGSIVDIESRDEHERLFRLLTGQLERCYASHGLGPDAFALLGMRRTRNAVTKVIKRQLATAKDEIREDQYPGETIVEIYADTAGEQIELGYREADSSRITPRCAALMAQHYFDLFRLALHRKPELCDLWIFDFNRFTEQESVRRGAEAAFVLYSWPPGLAIHIVNCIYTPNGKTGTIRVTHGP